MWYGERILFLELISSFHLVHDSGQTFSEADNISNNTGISFNPQISSEGNNVYVVWQMKLLLWQH